MDMSDDEERIVIESVRADGRKFRPSDWIERIATTLATFGADRRLRYARDVQPCMFNGEKCLMVACVLEQQNPDAYRFILKFAEDNNLRVQPDRQGRGEKVELEQRKSPAPAA